MSGVPGQSRGVSSVSVVGRGSTARVAQRRKSPIWARLLVTFGALLMIVSGGALVGGKMLFTHYASTITHEGGLGTAAAEGKSIDGPLNLLLVGIDERSTGGGTRADSIIIAHIPATHDSVYMVSIPRDTKVTIPANPKTKYLGGVDKINAAFQWGYQNGGGRDGGMQLLAETVSGLAGGLKFKGAAIVNFDGFKGVVGAIGGVYMCVDETVTSAHIGVNTKTGKEGVPYYFNADGLPTYLKPNMKPIVYQKGTCKTFQAWEALDYVRQRDLLANGDGDYGRQRHQQQFVKAMASKAMSAGVITNPMKINAILGSVGKAVSFYNNGIPLEDWIFTLKGISPSQIVSLKVNNGTYNNAVVNGQSAQLLDDTSVQMLKAIVADQMPTFLQDHPETVNNS